MKASRRARSRNERSGVPCATTEPLASGRRLARSVGPEHGDDLTGRNLEGHPTQNVATGGHDREIAYR
jgi:hypothetical protein